MNFRNTVTYRNNSKQNAAFGFIGHSSEVLTVNVSRLFVPYFHVDYRPLLL
jgi:hypothetical protein